MKPNKLLLKVQKLLVDKFSYFKDDNVLVVSEDKAVLPFAFIISDGNFPKDLLVSYAVDYPYSATAAGLALNINKVKSVRLVEDFFIAKNGNTYFGEEAAKYFNIERELPIEDIFPLSNTKH